METGLAGKSVIVTGGNANIGRGIVLAFAAEGAKLVIAARDEKAGRGVAEGALAAGALEKGIQPGFHNDPVAGVRSIRRVKALAEANGADIFFSHDMDAWRGYKHAPDHYEL